MSSGVQVRIGVRLPHHAGVLEDPPPLEMFEVISEDVLGLRSAESERLLETLERARALRPIRLHGVSMNLGAVAPLSEKYLARLRVLADRLEPECVSDHVRTPDERRGDRDDPLPLPWTDEALAHLAARVHHAQERLGRRLLLENPASDAGQVHSTMTEWEFLGELARRTGAGLLIDLNNLLVTARNQAFLPHWFLDGLPGHAVAQYHLSADADPAAGDVNSHHELWELFRYAVRRLGARPTIIEWEDRAPPFSALLDEARRARAALEEVPMSAEGRRLRRLA